MLAGLSAGAMCWFDGGVTTSSGAPEPTPGLGLLPGSLSVHADGQPARRQVFLDAIAKGEIDFVADLAARLVGVALLVAAALIPAIVPLE